jgi:uncharacterized membrane protein YgcG
MWFFKDNIIVLLLLLAVLFIMLFLLYCLTVLSRNNQPGLVVPLFYPPENMTPSEIGFMKNRGFKNDLVGADIVNLAVKGFITIAQNEGFLSRYEYTLTRTDQTQGMSEYDKDLLSSLFRNGQTVHIGKSQSSVISSAIDCVRRQCTKIAGNYISQDLINLMYKTVVLPIAGVIAFVIFEYHTPIGFIFCFIWIGIIFLVSPLLTLYTPQGRKLQDGIDGFELYLNTAEVDRMKIIGTPPTKTPELYEKYLPYAMALGVEDQWTEQFSSLFEKLEREGHPYRPRWYIGSRYRGVTFAHRLNSSLSSSISSSGKVPGRSSGSGGRGSSGGGGGGGGGGGW